MERTRYAGAVLGRGADMADGHDDRDLRGQRSRYAAMSWFDVALTGVLTKH